MVSKKKRLAIYCSARDINSSFKESCITLAKILAPNFDMVYGGGDVGLMGIISYHMRKNGAHVIGVLPHHIAAFEQPRNHANQLIMTDTMHERKDKMFQLADGFIILPGGIGTCEEFFEVLCWRQLGIHNKPICIFNDNDFWQHMISLINHHVSIGAAEKTIHDLYKISNTPQDIGAYFNNYLW